ncbi:(2Fe-2S)-binding protein [Aminithiophilus ramosus]|uniref:(2Fe-2S)-binding protein n=3 Tax=Synergistia TaxID=649775 RepID=A0A9Q7AS30_9BACT|nr:(2Fe-2S)-binding protein [Aminithiophilus ramosus]QVL37568.1 (2Fe-2S)-binding protein [Synergistota bacterium]
MTVNGRLREADVEATLRLVDLLRNRFGLTSVKEGCSEGECGACTVLVDGKAVTSCTVLAFQMEGRSVTTLEGLSDGERHPLQQAFIDNDAVQCGFCTPGMILSAKALLDANPSPTEEEVRRALEGNLCRCTGYLPIVRAVLDGAERLRSR